MAERKTGIDHTPHYVSLNEKEREQFLSDLGTFPPDEREAFHRLCRMWEREIPYDRATGGSGAATARNSVDHLLEKLRVSGYGLIRTDGYGQNLRKRAVLLTNQWDERFSAGVLEEELDRLLEPGRGHFPNESMISESGIEIAEELIKEVDYRTLARVYANPEGAPGTILRLRGLGNTSHIFTAHTAKRIVQAAIDRVKSDCLEEGPLELISRLRDSNLTDTRHVVYSKDPVAWAKLTSLFLEKREIIDAKKKVSLENEFYEACFVVNEFVKSQIMEARARKKQSEERRLDFDAIAQSVLDNRPAMVSEEELSRMVLRVKQKYGKEFDEFSREFYETVLTPGKKRSLPLLVKIDQQYIHRDRLFAEFRGHLATASEILREEYIGRMAYQLRHGSRSTDGAFLSRDNFETDIDERLYAVDAFLWEVMQNPALFAESVIQGLKQEKGSAIATDIRRNLSLYMDITEGSFLPLSHLLDLNMVTIFEMAFQRVPVLRQLIIRIAGRYEAYKQKYVTRTVQSSARPRYTYRDLDEPLPGPGQGSRRSAAKSAPGERPAGGSPRKSRSGKAGSPSQDSGRTSRSYNQKERDAAWQEFNDLLHE